jgi:histidine triad (HIT) family protein
MECIFCQIIKKEIPAQIVYEDESILVIKDIQPKAQTHLLLMSKQHFSSLADVPRPEILGNLLWQAKETAHKLGLAKDGYKVIINTGKQAGQAVFHLHLHILSGEELITKNFIV